MVSDNETLESLGHPDVSVPASARQAELERFYEHHKDTDAPYQGAAIRTLGELQWIMQQRNWSGEWIGHTPGGLPEGMSRARLNQANFRGAHLEGARLIGAYLQRADFTDAHLEGARLDATHLEDAVLVRTHLHGVRNPHPVDQWGQRSQTFGLTDLRQAYLNSGTILNDSNLGDRIRVADTRWNDVNLAVIRWANLNMNRLGDEEYAQSRYDTDGKLKSREQQNHGWEQAVRAYRALAIVLRSQGLYEQSDQFAYRAQICQRRIMRRQRFRTIFPYLGSLFLDLLAGYGYRPVRTIFAYLLVILSFTMLYMQFGFINGHTFTFHEGIIFSLTSFHGRGFFPGGLTLDDPITTVAAIEAVIGLIIEVSFIATFTQRFFGR